MMLRVLNPYPPYYRGAFACSLFRYPPDYRHLLRAAFPVQESDGLTVFCLCA